jgi:hypothetical protein
MTLKGISNKIRGDGDGHMRGMSCLLTAIELNPGNIQGGSDRPAGWAKGIPSTRRSKTTCNRRKKRRPRFGSLELGVNVGNRADPWTRWTYAGNNQPVAPSNSPYDVFDKLYGQVKDRENLGSVLDEVSEDLKIVSSRLGKEEREMLEKHTAFVRQMETDLAAMDGQTLRFPAPKLEPGVELDNDGIPKVSEMQADLLVNAFANDLARVGDARVHQLGRTNAHALARGSMMATTASPTSRYQQGGPGEAGEDQYLVRRAACRPGKEARCNPRARRVRHDAG